MCSLFVRGFSIGIKRFPQVLVFSLCVFTVCVREFLQVLYVKSFGVRALLRILLLGVSEVSRFKCQRISSGLVSLRFGYQIIYKV